MDKQLYDSYKKLESFVRDEIKYKLKDSPVGLRLLEFLDSCTNRNFHHREAISFLYREDEGSVDFTVLRNRYFKLRKKLLEELTSGANAPASDDLLVQEESQLYHLRKRLSANHRESLKQLTALEKHCREQNIFELLPAILDQMIFCNHALTRLDDNNELHARYEEALALQHDMGKMLNLGRRVYEINFRKGIRHAAPHLNEMHRIAIRNKDYPRFILCYHYVAMYYKLGSKDYLENMQVISRHYTAFKKLQAAHPLVPLLKYTLNYVKYQRYHISEIKVFYHYNKCEFQEGYLAMKELWDLVHSGDHIYSNNKTDTLYYNMVRIAAAAGHYNEAFEKAESWVEYLRENNQNELTHNAYSQMAYVYVEGYPSTRTANAAFFTRKLDEHLKALKRKGNTNFYGEALSIRSRLHFIKGEYLQAQKLLRTQQVKEALEDIGMYELYEELYALALNKAKPDISARKNALVKNLNRLQDTLKKPLAEIQLRWMKRMVEAMK
jgi:hypothetical protein